MISDNSDKKLELSHMSDEFVRKYVKADPSNKRCSSAQSKRLLSGYRKRLCRTVGRGKPLFDDKVIDLLRVYVRDPVNLDKQLDYLNNLRDTNGDLFSRNLRVYSQTESAMQRFAERDHPSFRWNQNYQQSLKLIKEYFSKIKLRPLHYINVDDVKKVLPKSNTHSGAFWLETGIKEKGKNLEVAFQAFAKDVDDAIYNGTFALPILLGNRTQASGEYDDEGNQTGECKHKTRVVSMVDLELIMAELMFAYPFQKTFTNSKFYAGGKDDLSISSYLLDWRSKYDSWISLDYSSFDQTISSWLIEDAFSIIKSCFVMNDKESALFDVIVHDFIHKDFYITEGVIHSDKGVPSGSMFTQIIDSLVNVIVVNTYFISKGLGVRKYEMMAMGDDNIIFCGKDIDVDLLSTYISKNFGLLVNSDKSETGLRRDNPKFLSRFWTYSGRVRHPNQLISRLAFPERYRDYSGAVGPEHVLMAFILTYDRSMYELMDVNRFRQDYKIVAEQVWRKVDHRYLPGSLAYQREYVKVA